VGYPLRHTGDARFNHRRRRRKKNIKERNNNNVDKDRSVLSDAGRSAEEKQKTGG